MPFLTITRTITETVRMSVSDLATNLEMEADYLSRRTPEELASYVDDYCQDGDDAIFRGARISGGDIQVQVSQD